MFINEEEDSSNKNYFVDEIESNKRFSLCLNNINDKNLLGMINEKITELEKRFQ